MAEPDPHKPKPDPGESEVWYELTTDKSQKFATLEEAKTEAARKNVWSDVIECRTVVGTGVERRRV